MFLICHVTPRENMLKGLNEFMSGRPSQWVTFGGHWSSASGDIKYLTCHVTLQSPVIEGSSNGMSGSSSWYIIITLPRLDVIGIVVVEI